jgi:hypothetical protein
MKGVALHLASLAELVVGKETPFMMAALGRRKRQFLCVRGPKRIIEPASAENVAYVRLFGESEPFGRAVRSPNFSSGPPCSMSKLTQNQ